MYIPYSYCQSMMIHNNQGIRGIACVFVITCHCFNTFGQPGNDFDRPHYIFTLPIIRLLLQGGYICITVFFVMSGYVCSIKPLKLARAGNPEEMRIAIIKSAFRRLFRLIGPATLATIISWFLDSTGGYKVARGNAFFYLPARLDFLKRLKELVNSCVTISSFLWINLSFVLGYMMDVYGPLTEIISKDHNGAWPMNYVGPWWSTLYSWSHPPSHPSGVIRPFWF